MPKRRGVRVTNYGAKRDGVTNDAPAIQMAIEEAMLRGGADVYLPSGVYKASGWHAANPDLGCSIELKHGVHLHGDGPENTIIEYGYEAHACIGASRKTGVSVSDIGFRQVEFSSGAHGAMKIYACNESVFENVWAHGEGGRCYYLASLNSCHDSEVVGGKAWNCLVGVKLMEAYIPYQTSENVWAIECEVTDTRIGFATQGWGPPYMNRQEGRYGVDPNVWSRPNNVHFIDCTIGDTTEGVFRAEYVSNVYVDGMTWTGHCDNAYWAERPFALFNVHGGQFDAISPSKLWWPKEGSVDYVSHGNEPCTDIYLDGEKLL